MAGGNDEHFVHECRRPPAGGDGNTPALPVDVFPKCAHFESPRQEEQRSTPAGMRTALSSAPSHPLAAGSEGLSRAPASISISQLASRSKPDIIAESTAIHIDNCYECVNIR